MFSKRNIIVTTILILVFGLASVYAQDKLKDGISAIKRGDFIKAVELLKSAVSRDEKNSYDGNLYYGIALYRTGSLDEAAKHLNIAVKIDDERPEAYSVLGEINTEQKKYSEAASYFETAKKYLPLNKTANDLDKEEIDVIIDVLTNEAENFSAEDKVDKAIASLTQARTYDNNNPMIYVGLGDAYLVRRAYEPAKTNYEKALSLKSNYAPAQYGLGKIAFRQKRYNDALDLFTKASESDPNFAEAYFEKGLILYLSDKFPPALDAFKKYSELKPGTQKGNIYYAKTQYASGKLDEAMTLLDEVLKIDPKSSEANKYKAYIYIEKKEFSMADEYFNKVPEIDFIAEDWAKRIKLEAEKKDFSKAAAYFNSAVKADSSYTDAYFEYGKALFNNQQYEESIPMFAKAIDMGILNLGAYIYEGIAYYNLKDYANAELWFDKSIEQNPKFALSWLWKGNAQASAGKTPEAIESYKKVIEIDPDNQDAKDQIAKLGGKLE
jgi:tetratricopeptide (TPR) repeat protein